MTVGTPRKKKQLAEGWCYCSRKTVSVSISGSSVTFLNVIVTCFCSVVKFAHLEWKSVDNTYFEIIWIYVEEKHCKVFLVYSDHEETPFDSFVVQQAGTYLPQSYLIHEQMIVTDRIENVDQLGFFIYRLCRGKETYKLQRKEAMKGKRSSCSLVCWQKLQWCLSVFKEKTLIEARLASCTNWLCRP